MNKALRALAGPVFWCRFHLVATAIWLVLVIPGLLWWKESIPFIVFMSLWANIAGHWSGWQASRAELEVKKGNGS